MALYNPPPPTTHRGAVRKDGAEIARGWSLPECITSSGNRLLPHIDYFPINSLDTAAPSNVVIQPRGTMLFDCYIERIGQIFRVGVSML